MLNKDQEEDSKVLDDIIDKYRRKDFDEEKRRN